MPDLDAELLERVARWCAEAGRTAAVAEIRRALDPLGWDELLAARALLADPPPGRPLGPFALADLARGTPVDVAVEREREGRYPSVAHADEPRPAPPPGAPAPRSAPARRGRPSGLVIRRARDAVAPAPPPPPAAPLLDELLLPRGRAVLERLVRRHGARRPALVAALSAGWRAADGHAPDDADLSRLLDAHGLARAFAHRERDELLHALRASGGLLVAAASRLGLDPTALDAALARVGATAEAERIREARRADVRARATLSQRVRLLLGEAARLADLGILAEVEEDLRRRLPDHLRALGAAGGPPIPALARSLSLSSAEARGLAERLGLTIASPAAQRPRAPSGRARPQGSAPARPAPSRPAPSRPSPGRPARPGPRTDRGRPVARRERPGGGRPPPRRPRPR